MSHWVLRHPPEAPRDRLFPLVYPPEPTKPLVAQKKVKEWKPKGPFRFFDLPGEIRTKIYEFALLDNDVIDLNPSNARNIAPKLHTLLACRQIYEEAYPTFYGSQVFRIFPTHPGLFHTKKALLTRLPKKYRAAINTLELRLGPGWSKPPKIWNTGPKLGLADCTSVRRLNIFVELDPSGDVFKGFRIDDRWYTVFSGHLLEELLEQIPSIREIHFEAFPSVAKDGVLMTDLVAIAEVENKKIIWGKHFVESSKEQCNSMLAMMADLRL